MFNALLLFCCRWALIHLSAITPLLHHIWRHAISNALEIDRLERSPRRCVRHLESCFGHTLPCCDPCAICYCRFFNAICYCRKIGNSCHQGKS
ncbi:agouti-related protein-like [Carcharodon carcharias]|uniref:agouti-related protein-like n=1 Tax=Carcharodon carcharias TaxID=13397 RepID=UPI001B7ED71E|nr:agouti-related protein-like [Carcharodon carcharias]